jgi:hypothetical protein
MFYSCPANQLLELHQTISSSSPSRTNITESRVFVGVNNTHKMTVHLIRNVETVSQKAACRELQQVGEPREQRGD